MNIDILKYIEDAINKITNELENAFVSLVGIDDEIIEELYDYNFNIIDTNVVVVDNDGNNLNEVVKLRNNKNIKKIAVLSCNSIKDFDSLKDFSEFTVYEKSFVDSIVDNIICNNLVAIELKHINRTKAFLNNIINVVSPTLKAFFEYILLVKKDYICMCNSNFKFEYSNFEKLCFSLYINLSIFSMWSIVTKRHMYESALRKVYNSSSSIFLDGKSFAEVNLEEWNKSQKANKDEYTYLNSVLGKKFDKSTQFKAIKSIFLNNHYEENYSKVDYNYIKSLIGKSSGKSELTGPKEKNDHVLYTNHYIEYFVNTNTSKDFELDELNKKVGINNIQFSVPKQEETLTFNNLNINRQKREVLINSYNTYIEHLNLLDDQNIINIDEFTKSTKPVLDAFFQICKVLFTDRDFWKAITSEDFDEIFINNFVLTYNEIEPYLTEKEKTRYRLLSRKHINNLIFLSYYHPLMLYHIHAMYNRLIKAKTILDFDKDKIALLDSINNKYEFEIISYKGELFYYDQGSSRLPYFSCYMKKVEFDSYSYIDTLAIKNYIIDYINSNNHKNKIRIGLMGDVELTLLYKLTNDILEIFENPIKLSFNIVSKQDYLYDDVFLEMNESIIYKDKVEFIVSSTENKNNEMIVNESISNNDLILFLDSFLIYNNSNEQHLFDLPYDFLRRKIMENNIDNDIDNYIDSYCCSPKEYIFYPAVAMLQNKYIGNNDSQGYTKYSLNYQILSEIFTRLENSNKRVVLFSGYKDIINQIHKKEFIHNIGSKNIKGNDFCIIELQKSNKLFCNNIYNDEVVIKVSDLSSIFIYDEEDDMKNLLISFSVTHNIIIISYEDNEDEDLLNALITFIKDKLISSLTQSNFIDSYICKEIYNILLNNAKNYNQVITAYLIRYARSFLIDIQVIYKKIDNIKYPENCSFLYSRYIEELLDRMSFAPLTEKSINELNELLFSSGLGKEEQKEIFACIKNKKVLFSKNDVFISNLNELGGE